MSPNMKKNGKITQHGAHFQLKSTQKAQYGYKKITECALRNLNFLSRKSLLPPRKRFVKKNTVRKRQKKQLVVGEK